MGVASAKAPSKLGEATDKNKAIYDKNYKLIQMLI